MLPHYAVFRKLVLTIAQTKGKFKGLNGDEKNASQSFWLREAPQPLKAG
jgi:hypothetical protein